MGLAAAALAALFVLLRLAVAADGDVTRFVLAGRTFVDPRGVEATGADLHVFPGNGYDGQFFWRLAVDPAAWSGGPHDGVAFDNAYRPPRIGYPLVAHLAAGGRADLVAWSLVAVNVAAVGLVAWAGADIARRRGRSPAWGLAVASAPGLVMAVGRNLAEAATVAALVWGIAALLRRRPAWAAAAWTVAVLSREQALLTVAGYALWRAARLGRARWQMRRPSAVSAVSAASGVSVSAVPTTAGRPPGAGGPAGGPRPGGGSGPPGAGSAPETGVSVSPGLADLPWVVPAAVFLTWQAVLWSATGELPLAAAGGTNLVPPFTDLVPGLVGWATGDLVRLHAAAPLQLAATVALVVAAARAACTVPDGERWPVVALGLATVAGTCLAASIWRDPSDLRHLVDLPVLSWVVLLLARRPPPAWAAVLAGAVWVATAAVRVAAV